MNLSDIAVTLAKYHATVGGAKALVIQLESGDDRLLLKLGFEFVDGYYVLPNSKVNNAVNIVGDMLKFQDFERLVWQGRDRIAGSGQA